MIYNQIKMILPRFYFNGVYRSAVEIHSGNVNNTYHLIYDDHGVDRHYVLQRLNTFVFKEPKNVMNNIALVTEHIRNALIERGEDVERQVLELIPTRSGSLMYESPDGGFWRAYTYIQDGVAYDVMDTPTRIESVGRAFGNFQKLLIDFPPEKLYDTIPNFHNTYKRFFTLMRAIDQDPVGRVEEVGPEIEVMFDHRVMMSSIVKAIDRGDLPLRVTHNDTKSNNVMLDKNTDAPLAVLDLDTVMPGCVLYDYGDAIRFGASTAAEDEPDVSKIALDMDKTYAFTKGFIRETNGFLTVNELKMLPQGIKVMTCELAMRFLTDYIEGDVYFKVNSPLHNIVRARAQIALLLDIERKEEQLNEMIDALLS